VAPHAPQLANGKSACVYPAIGTPTGESVRLDNCVSQPSSAAGNAGDVQLPKTTGVVAQLGVHRPLVHASDATFAPLQARPQPPQLLGSEVGSTHELDPAQKVGVAALHAYPHVLAEQVAVALTTVVVQALPHTPQLATLLVVFVSQSLPVAAQCAKPALQLRMAQAPLVHVGVPLAVVHVFPHAPQLRTSEAKLKHELAPEQKLGVPALHANPHLLAEQVAVALATVVVQALPHTPQLARLVAVFVSQSVPVKAQCAKPVRQLRMAQAPPAHVGAPFAVVHVLPHPPQLRMSAAKLTHELERPQKSGSAALAHANPHRLAEQVAVPLTTVVEQALLHAPQLPRLVVVFVSQSVPVEAQCAKPVLQLPTVHAPPAHAGVPLAVEHVLPHALQLLGSVLRLILQPPA
jgi:hypothetical protein